MTAEKKIEKHESFEFSDINEHLKKGLDRASEFEERGIKTKEFWAYKGHPDEYGFDHILHRPAQEGPAYREFDQRRDYQTGSYETYTKEVGYCKHGQINRPSEDGPACIKKSPLESRDKQEYGGEFRWAYAWMEDGSHYRAENPSFIALIGGYVDRKVWRTDKDMGWPHRPPEEGPADIRFHYEDKEHRIRTWNDKGQLGMDSSKGFEQVIRDERFKVNGSSHRLDGPASRKVDHLTGEVLGSRWFVADRTLDDWEEDWENPEVSDHDIKDRMLTELGSEDLMRESFKFLLKEFGL